MNLNLKESIDEKGKKKRTLKCLKERVSFGIFSLFTKKFWGKKEEKGSEKEIFVVKSEKKEEVVVPDKDLKDIIPEERGIPLKINEDVVEKIGEIEKLLGGTSIDEEEKREEKISDNDITFVTAEGKKKKYSKKGLKTVRMEALYDDIRNDIRQKIEQNSEDIEERERGSEGQIFRVRINLNGIESYVVAMKLRMDNNVENETKMLEKANDILAVSGIDINERAKVPNCYGTIEAKGENYLIMEYIDGKTLYTLTLETIIKTLIEKVKNTPLREFEEWIEGEMNIFEGSWKQEKKDELKKIKDHLESKDGPKINGKSFNDYKSFSNKEKQVMLTEIKRLEEKVKDEFSKKGENYKKKKIECTSGLRKKYKRYLQIFNEHKEDLLKMKIDFERDSIAESRYTQLRNDYDFAQKTYESIVKGGKRNIPDVSGIGLKGDERHKATNTFLQWIIDKELPIFSEEEARDTKSRIKRTLDIFHANDFYHRDLGENLRNLMFKRENGKPIPYIIDYGYSIHGLDYKEGPNIKWDPQHGGNSSVSEVGYAKDEKILSYITSGKRNK